MNTENLSTLKIHTLSQKQYDRELAAGNIERNAFYLTPDEGKNVYVGTGDMPDDCDFQIDPDGDVLEVPTKVSEFENDAGFITVDDLPSLNYVTPQMFGAVGDGVADDTDAVQAALDNGGVIYFPAGRYKTTRLLTVSKSCRIEMFKQYPNTYKKEYPLTPEDNCMGARIDTYSPEGGMLIGDAVEVDGLYIRAMEGFAGVVLKFDNTIGAYTYPAAARLKHIKLEIDSPNTIPVSMFDFLPDGSYHYILEDICLGRNSDAGYCEYGFRTDMSQTTKKWANNVTIRNLCIDLHADYPLYVGGDEETIQIAGWVFDVLTIQSYVYKSLEEGGTANITNRQGHINLVTLKNLGLTTFIGAYLWDVNEESILGDVIVADNVRSMAVIGCSEHFDPFESYLAPKMKGAENLNISNLEMSVTTNTDNTANTLKLFDGTNEREVDIPKVEMSDEQIGNAIGTWMDSNAQPKEVVGRNKFNYADENCIAGLFRMSGDTPVFQKMESSIESPCATWVSNYIEAYIGDIVRLSQNGNTKLPYVMAYYNSKYELIGYDTSYKAEHYTTGCPVTAENTAFIRIEFHKSTHGFYEDRATSNLCVTVNNGDITYEDYYTELVGGIGSFMALQSPNGEKYTLAVTNDGDVISKDEEGNLIIPEKPYITPQMFGAKADGVTDDTVAIQTMFDTVAGIGKVYFPHGNYLTTDSIIVEQVPDIEMDGVILSNHNGVALDLGTNTSTIIDKTIKIKIKKKGTKYEEGSVGLLLHSAARNTFYLDTVNNFETNVKLLSTEGKGIWFNTFHLNNLNYAKYGLYLDGSNNGWINDNLFIGGSISVDSDSTAITIDGGESNVFLKQGIEGAQVSVYIINGSFNSFLKSRCERATYGLVIDNGKENVMQSNYAQPQFVNNSRYTTNGIIQPGIHNTCNYPSVSIDKLEDSRFFNYNNKTTSVYCSLINSTTGNIVEDCDSSAIKYENGVWSPTSYCPVFIFDTTKNKKFEFGGNRPQIRVNLFDVNGKISLTEENISQYLIADQITVPFVNGAYGNGVALESPYGFEVSEEVVRIELVYYRDFYGSDGITGFDIRTEFPCYPIRDEILTIPSLPENGYIGARVICNGNLYTYNGTAWKSDVEITEQAAALIDAALLSALGSGVIE